MIFETQWLFYERGEQIKKSADTAPQKETQPVCCRCARSSRICDYSLRLIWEENALSRGKCHGRAGAWSKNLHARIKNESLTHRARYGTEAGLRRLQPVQHQTSQKAFLNTTTEHLILYYKLAELKCLPREASRLYQSHFRLLSILDSGDIDRDISVLSPSLLASSEVERILVDYYKNVVCLDSVHIYRDDEHDARQYIFSWALRSRFIYAGMLMVSANLLKSCDARFVPIAMEYRHKVLQFLRAMLSIDGSRSEVIMLACLLCTVEVSTRPSLLPIY